MPCPFSGLVRDSNLRAVQQVRLQCTEGSVEWIYPSRALRVVLEPVHRARHTTVCIKPFRGFQGASLFIEHAGELDLLMADDERSEQVHCYRPDGRHKSALFIQANPQGDISRRTVGFHYEFLRKRSSVARLRRPPQTACQPCNNTELLLAICNSDFVIRGSILNVSHDAVRQMSVVEVQGGRVYRQRSGVFEREEGPHTTSWRGYIHTLLACHVRPGDGLFLFTGSEHFGEAWLGCAPRFRDFLVLYHRAMRDGQNPCDFPLD
ncbi:meteorin-like protein [Engraulis encrasicolus]|uniref:meteorin-like protein n=1 Tax=Engraulis encrasicolus TaxID=184585 RepID=UPI002FD79ACF